MININDLLRPSGLIKNKKDFFIKFPIGLIIIILFGVSPILISMLGAWITELITNEACNEGNSIWGAFGWLFLITIPCAIGLFFLFLIKSLVDIIKILKNKN
jgi:MFS family permease